MSDVFLTTATTNFDKSVVTYVARKTEEVLRRSLRYLVPGAFVPGTLIPGTNLIRHISLTDLSILSPAQSDGTPPWLSEGVTPSIEPLAMTYDEYGVNQIGRLVGITDRALAYSPFDLMAAAGEKIAVNAAQTIDAVIASTVQAITATTTNGHAAAALTTSDYLTAAQVRLMVAKLQTNGVPPFPDGYYVAITHPYAAYDLQGDAAWVNVANYAAQGNLLNGEIGRLYGVRFVETTVGTWVNNTGGGAAVPVYSTLFFGRDYFAMGDFGSMEYFMVRPGGDHSDPLAQKAEVGYKGWVGAKVLSTLGTRAFRLVHAGSVAGAASI